MSTSRLTLAPVNLTGGSFGTWPATFPGNAPGVPASTTPVTNTNPYGVAVVISGGTLTFVFVNGSQVGTTAGTYFVPAGGTISITYSVAPTWTWTAAGADAVAADGSAFAAAWPQGALAGAGVQFPNQGTGLTYLMFFNGTQACTASYLIGQKYGGDTFPSTQEQQVLGTNTFGRLGPFSPNKYNQTDSSQFSSAPGGVVGVSGQGLTCIDFSNCATLLVRAYQVVPVNP